MRARGATLLLAFTLGVTAPLAAAEAGPGVALSPGAMAALLKSLPPPPAALPPPRLPEAPPAAAPASAAALTHGPPPFPPPAWVMGPHLSAALHAGDPTAYDALIRELAERYGVEPALVKAIIRAESAFDHRAVSPVGALGLMQLMPATAAEHGVRDVFVPRDNIEGGCRHLRLLLDRYRGNLRLALAAYNAGVQRVEEAHGVPPITETRAYLDRVLRYRSVYLAAGGSARRF